MVTEKNEQEVQQSTIILPYFDYEVPLLSLAGGNRNILVVVLCRMVGLCMYVEFGLFAPQQGRSRPHCLCSDNSSYGRLTI
jgi:hypothetical protein